MRRLSLQIYWTFVSILLLFVILLMIAWGIGRPEQRMGPRLESLGEVAGMLLPDRTRPAGELEAFLASIGSKLEVDLSVYDSDRELLASTGSVLPAPDARETGSSILRRRPRGHDPVLALHLPDGRWLLVREADSQDKHWVGLLFLVLLAAAVAIGAYPLVRRLTRRLERLRHRVEALGEGDLSARVEIEGKDEIADLARSFNEAAGRIDRLVNAQRNTLAAASHELRSPLARMRVAIDLIGDETRPEIRERIVADIGELDDLIGELLLASRLDVAPEIELADDIDLLGLAAEEAARVGIQAEGQSLRVQGDRRLLRRAIRNLVENAARHGEGSPIEIRVLSGSRDRALVRVCDEGPGIPPEERERIFEPFYRRAGARETGDGVGLGLSLVRQIAERHGGSARVRDRDGDRFGSCFEIELPTA